MVKRRRSDLDAEVYPIRARQRAALVRDVLHRGEVLAADPAVCVLEQIEPARAVVLERDAGLVFATDRRLLYRALNSQHRQAWPYRTVATRRLGRCTNPRLVCALPALARLRGRGWGLATWKFRTTDGRRFAVHGSRPFLGMIDTVVGTVDLNALPEMPSTVAVYVDGAPLLRCRECGTDTVGQLDYCAGCARTIDWNASTQAVDQFLNRSGAPQMPTARAEDA